MPLVQGLYQIGFYAQFRIEGKCKRTDFSKEGHEFHNETENR